jgi:hypothetical protein
VNQKTADNEENVNTDSEFNGVSKMNRQMVPHSELGYFLFGMDDYNQ